MPDQGILRSALSAASRIRCGHHFQVRSWNRHAKHICCVSILAVVVCDGLAIFADCRPHSLATGALVICVGSVGHMHGLRLASQFTSQAPQHAHSLRSRLTLQISTVGLRFFRGFQSLVSKNWWNIFGIWQL